MTEMLIDVYFETRGYAEHVASFTNEEIYVACCEALEMAAASHGFIKVTETMRVDSS